MSAPARHLPAPERRGGAARSTVRCGSPHRRAGAPRHRRGASSERPALKVVPRRVRRRRAGRRAVARRRRAVRADARSGGLPGHDRPGPAAARPGGAATCVRPRPTSPQLRLQVARLESPDRIVAEAERLGLQRPGPEEIAYLAAAGRRGGRGAGRRRATARSRPGRHRRRLGLEQPQAPPQRPAVTHGPLDARSRRRRLVARLGAASAGAGGGARAAVGVRRPPGGRGAGSWRVARRWPCCWSGSW